MSQTKMSWEQAASYCRQSPCKSLVSIRSTNEVCQIRKFFNDRHTKGRKFWIGLVATTTFVFCRILTSNEEAMSLMRWQPSDDKFTPFPGYEVGKSHTCHLNCYGLLIFTSGGQFVNYFCSNKRKICMTGTGKLSSIVMTLSFSYVKSTQESFYLCLVPGTTRRYFLITNHKSDICSIRFNGSLARFDSGSDFDKLEKVVVKRPRDYWFMVWRVGLSKSEAFTLKISSITCLKVNKSRGEQLIEWNGRTSRRGLSFAMEHAPWMGDLCEEGPFFAHLKQPTPSSSHSHSSIEIIKYKPSISTIKLKFPALCECEKGKC